MPLPTASREKPDPNLLVVIDGSERGLELFVFLRDKDVVFLFIPLRLRGLDL